LIGLYKAKSYEIAIILPIDRSKLDVVLRTELGKERIHEPVIYDSKGIRITK